jgi:N-acetylglucosamine-6-phosphate deacetylase
MIVLSGADLLLPDRILPTGTLVIEDGRIADLRAGAASGGADSHFAFHGHYIVPGFIDVHVHGVDGVDSLDAGPAIATIAARLPRYGVTAFCPTTVACTPQQLRVTLEQVRHARATLIPDGARVLPAHLESNFINPDFRGAQPAVCLRTPAAALASMRPWSTAAAPPAGPAERNGDTDVDFDGADILQEIERALPDVGIVTVASELDGGLELIRWLAERRLRISLGHSGATYDQALEAIATGARHATHLFNRMPPLNHREPGVAGAILQTDEVAAEIICDGFHVHPALVRTVVAAKGPSRIFAITDGTAASGLPAGAPASLGGRPIRVGDRAAFLEDGTIAGSVLTMDRAFQMLVAQIGIPLVDAATMCSTTPARELGLVGYGVLAPGAIADLVILDGQFKVVQTYIGGELVYSREPIPTFKDQGSGIRDQGPGM